ncbi:DUF1684 domain-containing protein [Algoriphagus taiwanensis]|uniref:DUF1684 domain-containing protein n=1 Tax=Algoriphagus taiwanensis TaxID=1445656 RepID=A0ABQ6Q381_9BACT|nr:DUF1684 domain-containing protein [Algoriphagus taiwanensis]
MFQKFLFFSLTFSASLFWAEAQTYQDSLQAYQHELNLSFADPETSPLPLEKINGFEGLPFFPIDENYRIVAKLEILPASDPFRMRTSDRSMREYDRYALAHFEWEGKKYSLTIYQNTANKFEPGEEKSLFLPFTDRSNWNETYGGGRYLDLEVPEGEYLVIDFNKAYNPYCAYSDRYSCPIPPKENDLGFEVLAGVKYEN